MCSGREHDQSHRQQSPDIDSSTDPSLQLALKSSAEVNVDSSEDAGAATTSKAEADFDAELALALHMQSDNDDEDSPDDHQHPHIPGVAASSSTTQNRSTAVVTKATIVATEVPVLETFSTMAAFLKYSRTSQCPKCRDRYFKCESDVKTLFQNWYREKGELSSLLTCKTCSSTFCIACQSTPQSKQSVVSAGSISVSWCCGTGRLLLIWLLLCGFDNFYCTTKAQQANMKARSKTKPEPPSQPSEKGKEKARVSHVDQDSGIGYGGEISYRDCLWSMAIEAKAEDFEKIKSEILLQHKAHGRNRSAADRALSNNKSRAISAQDSIDEVGTTILALFQHIFPSLERGHAFDTEPPKSIVELLLHSRTLDHCIDLLENDSLDDAFIRKPAYDALLDFVEVIGTHSTTARLTVFLKGRPIQHASCNLLTISFSDREGPLSGRAPSIADSLRKLSKTSESLMKTAKHHETDYSESDRQFVSFCQRISGLWQKFSAHIAATTPATLITDSTSSTTEVPAVADVSDAEIFAQHAFSAKAQTVSGHAPGRLRRLLFELNVLRTSLPAGIFIRHGESRIDVLKCIIIGSRDTPYENGIFEFDIFCSGNFPSVPPSMLFKGTRGGTATINPNLYANGKVCLSLLGTWHGEPWKPSESTLLQILVSIQAMVLCENPWYNEPGRDFAFNRHMTAASASYNHYIREMTVRIAILSWLETPSQIWADVVAQHFKANANAILQTGVAWSNDLKVDNQRLSIRPMNPVVPYAEYPPLNAETTYGITLPKLHKLLLAYGAAAELPVVQENTEPQHKKPRVENPYYEAIHGQNGNVPVVYGPTFGPQNVYYGHVGVGYPSLQPGQVPAIVHGHQSLQPGQVPPIVHGQHSLLPGQVPAIVHGYPSLQPVQSPHVAHGHQTLQPGQAPHVAHGYVYKSGLGQTPVISYSGHGQLPGEHPGSFFTGVPRGLSSSSRGHGRGTHPPSIRSVSNPDDTPSYSDGRKPGDSTGRSGRGGHMGRGGRGGSAAWGL